MAKKSKKAISLNKKGGLATVIVFCVISLLITLNETVFQLDFIPSWSSIYSAVGINDGKVTDAPVSVHFLDVGQGDSALILTPAASVLIDCGESDYAGTVLSYLNAQGVKKLDYVIVTHPHSDHMGGMAQIVSSIDVSTVIMPKIQDSILPTTSVFIKMLEAIQQNNIQLEYAKSGKVYDLGEGCTLEILAPVSDYDDLNNYSIVSRFSYLDTAFLFTGDIESTAEKDILELGLDISADVLSVPHHGSKTSSTKQFILGVNPRYAVFSLGSPNSYGHPHQAVTQRYSKLDITLLRTDECGHIVFETDGSGINILAQKEVS